MLRVGDLRMMTGGLGALPRNRRDGVFSSSVIRQNQTPKHNRTKPVIKLGM